MGVDKMVDKNGASFLYRKCDIYYFSSGRKQLTIVIIFVHLERRLK
jgi:hypothetical protein